MEQWNTRTESKHIAELQAELAKARDVLEPFAEIAERDIGDTEDANDFYRPMGHQHARGPIMRVGHLRAASAFLSKQPEPNDE